MTRYRTESEEETIALGEELARLLPPAGAVLLIGNLGAGKTTLAKGIAAARAGVAAEEVSSPTFTLVHEYGSPPAVYHIDLYRIEEERQLATLPMDEIFDSGALVLLEWAERFPRILPPSRVEIRIRRLEGDARDFEVERIG